MKNTNELNKKDSIKEKYNYIARWYDLFEFIMELLFFRRWRRQLFKWIKEKKFLEIGIGTGKNLKYYPPRTQATAIDFSKGMLSYAKKRAVRAGSTVSLKTMDVQDLHFNAHLFPNVIGTFVFCSVPDPVRGLKEVRRVLTPSGRVILLEHVRPRNPLLGKLFDLLNPMVVRWTGVNINRDTAENIRRAGFHIELERNLLGNVFKLFVARP